jgi:S-DNA-T family DNA segregation ATPase FtsK/SpoIIIE
MNTSSKLYKGTPAAAKVGGLLSPILGILLIGMALLTVVSLISHSPEDFPNSSRPPELTENRAGWVGAYLSCYLFWYVGYGAYGLAALVLLWGWNRFRQLDYMTLVWHTVSLLAAIVLYCGATGIPSRGRTDTAFRMGGSLGTALSGVILVPYLGRVGSYIFLITAFLVLLMLTTRVPLSRVPDLVAWLVLRCWAGVLAFVRGIAGALGRWRTRRAERREERAREAEETWAPAPGALPGLADDDGAAEEEEGQAEVYEWDEDEGEDAEEDAVWEPEPVELEPARIDEGEDEISEPEIVAPSLPPSTFGPVSPRRRVVPTEADYELPSQELLDEAPDDDGTFDREELLEGARTLERSLGSFGIEGKVVQVNPGPVISCYEVEPPSGVKVNRIVNLSDDLALVMKARSIRIQAPVPGKAVVGIEVPNPRPSTVYLREILESDTFQATDARLMLALGKTASGDPFSTDLADMPHLLIAGATGSGKSVCINALITSILIRKTPLEVRFLMVDPKMLELTIYDDIPHLLAPVVTEPKKAAEALKWAVGEMEERYRTMARYSVRNILDYNRKLDRMRIEAESEEDRLEVPAALPYIIVVIDELADLMMTAPADIEDSLARLAQMARAVGIHMILATQRPSVNVITGTIKANFPSRIAFRVASKVDSRTILDANGAEKLLGRGDMLFMPTGRPEPIRIHGANISTEETERLVEWARGQDVSLESVDLGMEEAELAIGDGGQDERFDEALRLVVAHQQGSASLLQRRMKVGYARAARLVDQLEQAGIVGPSDGSSKAREVLVDESYLDQLDAAERAEAESREAE